MIEPRDIHWLAGLAEGEGCFFANKQNRKHSVLGVKIAMTDRDVVAHARSVMGSTTKISAMRRAGTDHPEWKDQYATVASGHRAAAWMMTLYPLMGERRRAKIRELLGIWKSTAPRYVRKNSAVCPSGHANSPENTYVWRGNAHCRPCRVLATKAYRATKKAARQ